MGTPFGKYELERELGRGANGIVYLARDPLLQRPVALKRLVFPHTFQGQERVQVMDRFTREARAIAAIRHPSIPQIFEISALNGQPFLVMEFCPGHTLREELTMRGPLPPNTALLVVRQILGALEAAHQAGILHRDIKPDNIIFDAGSQTAKLTDFGVARLVSEQTLTAAGSVLGSPAYMAPEQVLGKAVDARTDLFSVGILLCELLTGVRPFQGQTITQITHAIVYGPPGIPAGLPPHIVAVIQKAVSKEPSGRFQTASEMNAALANSGRSAPGGVGMSHPSATATIAGYSGATPPVPQRLPPPVAPPVPPQLPPPVVRPFAAAPPPIVPQHANLMPCPSCGNAVSTRAFSCPGCGHPFAPAPSLIHTPGGAQPLPAAAQRLNWGAFFLTLFWAISNQVWIGLLCLLGFIPYIGPLISWGVSFYLLFKGGELAWRSGRPWRSEDEFAQVQASWNGWGIGLVVTGIVLMFGVALLAMIAASTAG